MQLLVPDFICIGVQKAGTTWLYNQLVANPLISIPKKECNILTEPEGHLQRYTDFYTGTHEGRLLGDVSPFYATQPVIAQRIREMNPDCKVIIVLRDPVARAFSQYRMATKAERIPPETTLWRAFRKNMQFMQQRGCYLDVLRRFDDAGFDRRNILPLPFEWIGEKPLALMDRLNAFLGIEGDADDALMAQRFASYTQGAQPPEKDAARIRKWYASRNAGLREYLWWQPEWL